jgi:MFS family permease
MRVEPLTRCQTWFSYTKPMLGSRRLARRPELLRQRAFGRLWAALTVSYLGDQVTVIALPFVAVLALDATTAQVAYLATAGTLPLLLMGIHAGDWVDRVGRRRLVLVSADVARALLLGSIPIAYALGRLGMAQLYAVAALTGAAAVMFNVGAASIIPALVAPDQRVAGNSLLRGSFSFSWVAGPGAGGLLVQIATAPAALIIDALSFLASASLIRGVSVPNRAPHDRSGEGVRAGLRFVARHAVLRPYLLYGALLNFCYTTYFTLLIVFAARELHLTPGQIGLAIGAGAVGAFTSSVLTTRITRRLGIGASLILGALLYAGALLAIPLASRTDPWAAWSTIAAAEFVSGFGLMLCDINGTSLHQTVTPERLLGRVAGASMAMTYGARSLAGLAAAALGTWLGLAPTITLAAAIGVASTLILISSPIRTIVHLPEHATSPDGAATPG